LRFIKNRPANSVIIHHLPLSAVRVVTALSAVSAVSAAAAWCCGTLTLSAVCVNNLKFGRIFELKLILIKIWYYTVYYQPILIARYITIQLRYFHVTARLVMG